MKSFLVPDEHVNEWYSRRAFLGSGLGLAAMGIACAQQSREIIEVGTQPDMDQEFDVDTADFWKLNGVTTRGAFQVQEPVTIQDIETHFLVETTSSPAFLSATPQAILQQARSSIPEFLFWNESNNELEYPGAISDDGIPDAGDMEVTVTAQRFRLSKADQTNFANVETASLRLDLEQSRPMPGLPEAIAASAVAAIVPDSDAKFPQLQDLVFDPGVAFGRPHTLRLPDGEGSVSWNFFLKKRAGFFGKLVDWVQTASNIATPLVPLLGLPSVGLTALKKTKEIMGFLQAQDESTWLYQDVRLQAYATKKAKSQVRVPDPMPLKTGDYVVVPRGHLIHLSGEKPQLFRSVLLPSNLSQQDKQLRVWEEGVSYIPDLTYVTLHVDVRPAAQV